MTSDAKIGLLLGLVFIFVIAFLINGLPSFTQADDNNELTTNMVTSPNADDIDITAGKRKLTERKITRETITDNQANKDLTTKSEDVVAGEKQVKKDIRFERDLPQKITKVSKSPQPNNNKSSKSPEKSSAGQREKLPTKYVVQKGDSLASIAKKFYGENVGNELENVDKIFKANRSKLNSRDEIYVGQTLLIPPLSSTRGGEGKGIGDKISEKLHSIGEKLTGSKRYYTVKEDDNLWRIAYKCLGDGSRYKEIARMNGDKLESEDRLSVGMKLVIPAK